MRKILSLGKISEQQHTKTIDTQTSLKSIVIGILWSCEHMTLKANAAYKETRKNTYMCHNNSDSIRCMYVRFKWFLYSKS